MAVRRHGLSLAAFIAILVGGSKDDLRPAGWIGLGNTDSTFVEDGVDKSPIRGLDADGKLETKGLGDDESFKLPEYVDTLSSDPQCDRAGAEWVEYRRLLSIRFEDSEEDEDHKAMVAWQFFLDTGMRKFKKLDNLSNTCFLGVVATLYQVARHRMMVEDMYNAAAAIAKSLDRFVASIHPAKFDAANKLETGSPLWPVSDREVGHLLRYIAKFSRGRGIDLNCESEKGCTEGAKPMHGNIFHALPNDTLLASPPYASGVQDNQLLTTLGDAFKIYVYDVNDYEELLVLAAGASFCKDNQWGFEVLLHWYFLACDCRTDNPIEADFFFVPQYTACHLNLKTFEEEESNTLFESLIPKLKHFRRSGGTDHIFVWGAGYAVDGPFRNWKMHINDSIFLMTETEFWNPYKWQTEPNFAFAKDIVLPGRLSVKEIKQHNELARPLNERPYTGDFVGWNRPLHTAQGTAESPRQRLLKWAAKYPDMHIRQDVPYMEALFGSVSSKFCFVPRGKSAWSSRLFRTLFGKCVPVLLNDDYELPFMSLLANKEEDWVIRWPMREVTDELVAFLQNFSIEKLEQMVDEAIDPKCLYFWHPPVIDASHWEVEDGDLDALCPKWRERNAYLAVMTLLFNKKRRTKSGHKTFYLPAGSAGEVRIVDEKFTDF